MAIDLGTANTLVYVPGQGVVLNEPSVVAVNTVSGATLAVGAEAKLLIGRTPSHVRAIRPLKDGVIAHFGMAEKMLSHFIKKVRGPWTRPKPRVVVCLPSAVTEVEQRAVLEATKAAGAKATYLIEEPMAAAIGAGLPIQEPAGMMVVDIGGGTTGIAIISYGGIVTSASVRVGGDEMDDAIIHYVKKTRSIALGERTAETIKLAIGSAWPVNDEETIEVKGRDLTSGLPRAIELTGEEVRKAIGDPVNTIVDSVRETLDRCPPELAGDVMERGILLAGGGALLKSFDRRLSEETGLAVFRAEDPLTTVAVGAGRCLEQFDRLKPVLTSRQPEAFE